MPKDRGDYVSTYVALVDDPDFKSLSAEARLLFWTLKHWPEGNKVGIFAAFPDALMDRSGLGKRALLVAREELKAARVAYWDGNIVWIRNHLRFSPELAWKNEKQMAGLRNEILGLPKTSLLNNFVEYYKGLGIPIEWDSIPSSTTLFVPTLPDPIRTAAIGSARARRSVSVTSGASSPVNDTPENRAPIEAYNAVFGTRVGPTPGNLRASARAFEAGYTLDQMRQTFEAVKARATAFAAWCASHDREFEYLIRPDYVNGRTGKQEQSPIDKILNELATGRKESA
jgi:hypothetical protein